MPFETPTPATPWIRGASPMEAVVPGAELGQRIAESNQRSAFQYMQLQAQREQFSQQLQLQEQRLQQQQELAQQELAAKQDIAHQNALREDQQNLIENAYKQSTLGLAQSKLDFTKKVAADQFNAQQAFVKRIPELTALNIAQGQTPDVAEQNARMQSFYEFGPRMGASASSVAGMIKSTEAVGNPELGTAYTDQGEINFLHYPGSKSLHVLSSNVPKPQLTADQKAEASDITAQIHALDKAAGETSNYKKKMVYQAQAFDLAEQRNKLLSPKTAVPAPTGTTDQPATPSTAPKTPVPEILKRWRYNPSTGKLEEITQADTQPTEEEDASVTA